MGAAMDAANMLKPSLVRGDFRVIGATTGEEYDRWIGGDPALERRFQKVMVRELGVPETLEHSPRAQGAPRAASQRRDHRRSAASRPWSSPIST